jgi:hypothetical protein
MAIRSLTSGGFAAAGTRTNFLSALIVHPIRPLSIVIQYDGATLGDSFNVFLTKSDVPIDLPQPGDESALDIRDFSLTITAATIIPIPLFIRETVTRNHRLGFSFNNTGTAARNVLATLIYEDKSF